MTESWTQWEGRVIEGLFPLQRFVAESDHSVVFVTEYGENEAQKAVIKLMPARPGNAQVAEPALAKEVSHPNLLRVFAAGRCQVDGMDLRYVVMEFAGEDLPQILAIRTLTADEAGEMLPPVLDALAYIHGKGLAHGHLKPANIMAVNDQLKVASDGLCEVGERSGSLEEPSVYDAPEIATSGASAAGDVWSLGATLVQALTQEAPAWRGAGTPALTLSESMPAVFREIALNCLEQEPARRLTIEDIRTRLHADAPIIAPQEPETPHKASSHSKLWMIPLAALVLLVAILGGMKLFRREPPSVPVVGSPEVQEPVVASGPEEKAAQPESKPPSPATSTGEGRPSSTTPPPGHIPSTSARVVPERGAGQSPVLRQVLPEVSRRALGTIKGTVRVNVRVRVDAAGKVAGATFESEGPSRYFANVAMRAAQRWEFAPAPGDVQHAPRQWSLRFEFRRSGGRAEAVEVHP